MTKIFAWLHSTRGATAIEYGLIVGAIGVAVSVVVFTMGDSLVAIFTNVNTRMESVL